MSRLLSTVTELRTLFWHLRTGGIRQARTWRRRDRAQAGIFTPNNVRGVQAGWSGWGKSRTISFRPIDVHGPMESSTDLRVAILLDEFSERAFGFEWLQTRVSKGNWKEQLQAERFDLLFVESAWNGNAGEWKFQLTGSSGPKSEFLEMVRWCRSHGIPTVFWNKEDPPHYNDFLAAAAEFDYVYTSDVRKVEDYKRDLKHDRIGVLPFAAQPKIHNPVRPHHGFHSRDVAFAGMYFRDKYPERRKQMDFILGGAGDASSRMKNGLEIFSRQFGGAPEYQFPPPLDKYVVGSLTYSQMLSAYKAYKVFLNVNSVEDSPSMCARRVFEISASGTPVISSPSEAIRNFFSEQEVPIASTRKESESLVRAFVQSSELNDRTVHLAQRRIWTEHVYANRVDTVIADVLPDRRVNRKRPSVSALVSTFRPEQVGYVFSYIAAQIDVDVELVLLTHGFSLTTSEIRQHKFASGVEQVTVIHAPPDVPLGKCLNLCIEAAAGDVLAKMDDDDHYGPCYLSDQLHALSYSGAQIVGKQAHYMYLSSSNATILRNAEKEHRFTNLVMGPTIVTTRELGRKILFPEVMRGEDTGFLDKALEAGASLYSADRFNFYQVRTGKDHTWKVSDLELMASSKLTQYGKPDEHTDV